MRRGVRLDPFSARLLSIHQKAQTFNPPPHEEHGAQGVLEVQEVQEVQAVGVLADADEEPVLDLASVEAVDTGCDACGGGEAKTNGVVEELRRELAFCKERLAALEEAIEQMEEEKEENQAVYRSA